MKKIAMKTVSNNIACSNGKNATVVGFFILCLVLLFACKGGSAYVLAPQKWDDVQFVVEIRPGAPTVGMNEFLVIATNEKGVPGYQYVVSLRFKGSDKWIQSIQDGHSGVYRRAINVRDPVNGILQVLVQHKKEEEKSTVFEIPLTPVPS